MIVKIPLRLLDFQKVKKTGRGYTHRELTVVELLRELSSKTTLRSFLNVGFHDYQDIRNRWWIDICRANGIDWHILEIFEPNVQNFTTHAPPSDRHRITHGSLQDIATLFDRSFDVVLHWHGPEHLERQVFLQLLPSITAAASKLLIFGCPDGLEEQGEAYGNPYEKHISFWSEENFHELGFQTKRVSDKKPGHITAYKNLL